MIICQAAPTNPVNNGTLSGVPAALSARNEVPRSGAAAYLLNKLVQDTRVRKCSQIKECITHMDICQGLEQVLIIAYLYTLFPL